MSSKRVYGYTDDGKPLFTQREVVRNYLFSGKSISQLQAWEMWGFSRLSAIIFDIRRDLDLEHSEYRIVAKDCSGVNRYGFTCTWTEYKLVKL